MSRRAHIVRAGLIAGALVASALVRTGSAQAASSNGCTDGGFRLVNLTTGATVATVGNAQVATTIPAAEFGDRFAVRGSYAQFDVRSADFAALDQAFTGATNPLDITGGRFTPVFASKVPDHRGLVLSSAISVQITGEDLVLQRAGTGLSMKIEAKDCARGESSRWNRRAPTAAQPGSPTSWPSPRRRG